MKEYREGKAKEWKKRTTKDQGSEKKKKDDDVVVNIGLMEWNDKEHELRRKHGKRLPLRVSPSTTYATLLQEAEKKWQNFHSNLYDCTEIYSLLYEDGRIAMLLPGSTEENFTLKRYREEIGKDYKSITFYLCTKSDFQKSDFEFGDASFSESTTLSNELIETEDDQQTKT